MSKRLLAKIEMNGAEYRITYENRPRNPYRITRRWWDLNKHGWKTETKVRFADYTSCLYWIAEEANKRIPSGMEFNGMIYTRYSDLFHTLW